MFSDIFHVSRLYQCITHSSPSLTASLAILVPKQSPFSTGITRFQFLKNPSATIEADCRDLTRLCLRSCVGVKLRAASGP